MSLYTEAPRYTLPTLQALFYGATYGGVTSRGIVKVTTMTPDFPVEASVLAVGPHTLLVETGDGITKDIEPGEILHAEVV